MGPGNFRRRPARPFHRWLSRRSQPAAAADVFSSRWRKPEGNQQAGRNCLEQAFVEQGRLKADLGRALAVELPREEVERRWNITTPQWPIMNVVLSGVTRDQMMARHKANHIQVAYAENAQQTDEALTAKCSCFHALRIDVFLCGTISK